MAWSRFHGSSLMVLGACWVRAAAAEPAPEEHRVRWLGSTEGGVSLALDWPAEASCATLDDFLKELRARVGPLKEVPPPVELEFRVELPEAGKPLTLEMRSDLGRARRTLPETDCADSVRAVAFVVAVLLDERTGSTESSRPPPSNEASSRPGPPENGEAPTTKEQTPKPSAPASDRTKPAPSAPPAKPSAPSISIDPSRGLAPSRRLSLGIGAAGTLESGLVPSLAFGMALAGRVGLASEVSGFYPELRLLLGQTQSNMTKPLARVDVTKLALTLAGCPYALSVLPTTTVRPCIGYEVGRVQARARLDAAPVRTVLWSSLAFGVGVGQTILSTRLDVWAGARAHLVRPAYFVTADGEPVNLYRVPRWGFFSGISLTFGEM